MNYLRQSLLVVLFCPLVALQAQPSTGEVDAVVRAEIEKRHKQEQEAFVEGNCDEVVSFYSADGTIFANGRRVPSLQAFREFCSKIPRPFEGGPGKITDSFHVLSENAAYFVRTINLEPADENSSTFNREVITKVWSKTDEGWKIVHFHSSVQSVSGT